MFYRKDGEYDTDKLYQGDILDNFPFFILPGEEFNLLEENFLEDVEQRNYRIEQYETVPARENLVSAVDVKRSRVAVLSQTCDIQQRDFVMIAPVFPLARLIASGDIRGGGESMLRARKEGKYNYLFYLEPDTDGSITESVIDLQQMHYFSKQLVLAQKDNRILAMSDWGQHHLGWKLSCFFGRPVEKKE